jgi:hypothetical protein
MKAIVTVALVYGLVFHTTLTIVVIIAGPGTQHTTKRLSMAREVGT